MKPNSEHAPLPTDAGEESIASLDKIRNSKGNLHTAEIRRKMQRTMQVGSKLQQLHLYLLAVLICERGPCWLMADGCHGLHAAAARLGHCIALPSKQELASFACSHSHTDIVLQEVKYQSEYQSAL